MKLLILGDIHGENLWEYVGDIRLIKDTPNIQTDFDKYIFLGDYADSFVRTVEQQKQQLESIIKFKLNYPDQVHLLIGNHDLYYMFTDKQFLCSGNNGAADLVLGPIYKEYLHLFEPALTIGDYLFSHAGVVSSYVRDEEKVVDLYNRLIESYKDYVDNRKKNWIFNVGYTRGGRYDNGGIFWADAREYATHGSHKGIPSGFNQVVGHTPVKEINTLNRPDGTGSVTFIDTHHHSDELGYELNLDI